VSKTNLLDIAAHMSLLLLVIEVLWPKLVHVVVMIARDVAAGFAALALWRDPPLR
jgi:hypothetical protein